MYLLQQSTAATVPLGPFLDSADGDSEEDGLTIGPADVRLSKAGAAFAGKSEANTLIHDEHGWYPCGLNTTDTNTLGPMKVAVHATGALSVWATCLVVPAKVYASLVAGTDNLEVDSVLIEGSDATNQVGAAVAGVDLAGYEATGDDGTRLGDMVAAARAFAAGRLTVASNVLTLYEADGTTVFATRALTPSGGPYTGRSA